MRRDRNRTFFYFETENDAGQTVVRVGSEKAPLWGKTFANIADAIAAIKKRNSEATNFREIRNGLVAVYEGQEQAVETSTPGE